MKSNKTNKSIGKLTDQEVNTDQVQGGKAFVNQEYVTEAKMIPAPGTKKYPKLKPITSTKQQLGE